MLSDNKKIMEQIFPMKRQPAQLNEEYQRACLLHRPSFKNRHLIYVLYSGRQSSLVVISSSEKCNEMFLRFQISNIIEEV